MPGFKNVGSPKFLGAGLGGYRGDTLSKDTADSVAKEYTKGYVGGNAWNLSIPVWEDRNVSNNGTKLNP